jgi:ABC-type multidrug transport system fused ATPase/permease subunit
MFRINGSRHWPRVMKIVNTFRVLVLSSFVAALLAAMLDAAVPGLVPRAIDDAYSAYWNENGGKATVVVLAGILLLALFVTVSFLQLKRWSRSLAFWTTVASFVAMPMIGPSVQSGWALMLADLSASLWAGALSMAYFSELKLHFESV